MVSIFDISLLLMCATCNKQFKNQLLKRINSTNHKFAGDFCSHKTKGNNVKRHMINKRIRGRL